MQQALDVIRAYRANRLIAHRLQVGGKNKVLIRNLKE
jgi:hypothetical protein